MTNSFWEEQTMKIDVLDYRTKMIESMNLPKWMCNIICPYCKKSMSLDAVRFVGLQLNARNIGDISIEFFCNECKKMDTIYYIREVEDSSEFCQYLSDEKQPKNDPVLEKTMYKMQYNNVMEKFIERNKFSEGDEPLR